MEKTAIVILNYKNFSDTIHCIASAYENFPKENFQIIVVDNASGNDSLAKIKEHFKLKYKTTIINIGDQLSLANSVDILLVQNNENRGYAAGNNIGLRIGYDLGFQYLMVLNNDTLFIDNCLNNFKKIILSNANALCVGPLLLKGDRKSIDYNCAKRRPTYLDIFRLSYFGSWLKNETWQKKYYYLKKYPDVSLPIDVDIISGSCMYFDAQKFHEINFFDERTFLYYEEAILHEKARMKGYKMMLDPQIQVIHLGAQTTKKETTTSFMSESEYKSLRLYLEKYRNLSKTASGILTLSYWVFIYAYKFKNRLDGKFSY